MTKTKQSGKFMNFVAVVIVFAIVSGHSFSKKVDIWLAFDFVLATVVGSPR